jgi:iron complex outermembrane receptor protein
MDSARTAIRAVQIPFFYWSLGVLALALVIPLNAKAVDEIVVTALGRASSLQDAPASVQVFTAENIRNQGIERATDFIALTPGVSIVDAAEVGDTQVNIRGINGARDAENSFALVIDGVLMTNPAALNREYANIEQIEILKGPQGALYGRNAAAGAIIINTKRPGDELTGSVKGSYAEHSSYLVTGDVSGPLSDSLFWGLSGDFRSTDGFFSNTYASYLGVSDEIDSSESWNINGRLVFEPSDELSVDAKLRYGEVDGSSIIFNSVFHIPAVADAFASPAFAEDVNDHPFLFNPNLKSFNNQEATEFSLKVDYDLGWADLTGWGLYSDIENDLGADGTSAAFGFFWAEPTCSIFGGDPVNNDTAVIGADILAGIAPALTQPQFLNPDGYPTAIDGVSAGSIYGAYTPTTCDGFQYQVRNQKDYSFELRLASKDDQALRWSVGAYYLDIDREVGVNLGIDRGNGVIPRTLFTTDPMFPTEQLLWDQFDSEVWAVFGQLSYDLTDTVEVSFAARYDEEKREARSLVPVDARSQYIECENPFTTDGTYDGNAPINPGFCAEFEDTGTVGPQTTRSETFNEFQPKLSLTWDFADEWTAFTSLGVGFKSGGFNNFGSEATVETYINDFVVEVGNSFQPVGEEYSDLGITDRFEEETSTAFELGTRGTVFDGSVSLEAAYFRTEVDDMQFFEFLVGPFGLLRVVSNIDEVTIDGFEAAVNWQATDRWSFYAAGSIVDSEIDKNDVRPESEGNKSPYTPDWTANLGAQLTVPFNSNWTFISNLDISMIGETWFHVIQEEARPNLFGAIFNAPFPSDMSLAQRDSYTLVNLRAGIESENLRINVFADNLFDEAYLEEVIPAPEFGGSFIHPGTSYERTAGIEAIYSF